MKEGSKAARKTLEKTGGNGREVREWKGKRWSDKGWRDLSMVES